MKSIRSHYVPQFYLRNFGQEFYCYDKTNGNIFKTTPKRIAYETDFYGPELGEGTPSIEKALSNLERKSSIAVSELIETEDFTKLTTAKKLDLLGFFAMQHLRTKERRVGMEKLANSVLKEISKAQGVEDYTIRLNEKSLLGMHLKTITEYPAFAVVMSKMKIITLKNNTDIPLWTSDSPVTLQNEIDQYPFGNLGITCRGIEMHLPINPKLGLMVCDPTIFHPLPDVYALSEENVIRENFLQTTQSTRFIISNDDKFHLAKEMLDSNSMAKNPDRERFKRGIGSEEFEKELKEQPQRKFATKMDFWIDPGEMDKIMKDFDDRTKKKL